MQDPDVKFAPLARGLTALELFAGAGGLALGVERDGFEHLALNENDVLACATLRRNRAWKVIEQDARTVDWAAFEGKVDLIAGGTPCQPFSFGGRHRGRDDSRNLFPELLRAIAEVRPRAVVLENVRGLGRSSFAEYLDYIIAWMARPSLAPKQWESADEHGRRLRKARHRPDEYRVLGPRALNAADFGVPQTRHRLFLIALRADVSRDWVWPEATHSLAALMHEQVSEHYWDRLGLPASDPVVPPQHKLASILCESPAQEVKPWVTLREAIAGLPSPALAGTDPNDAEVQHHVRINTEARLYHGHTGNVLDLPGKTVKAGVHGTPGGEGIVTEDDGSRRRMTVRENARVQTFSDDYAFSGTRTQAMRQIGNAVPIELAHVLARQISNVLQPTGGP